MASLCMLSILKKVTSDYGIVQKTVHLTLLHRRSKTEPVKVKIILLTVA